MSKQDWIKYNHDIIDHAVNPYSFTFSYDKVKRLTNDLDIVSELVLLMQEAIYFDKCDVYQKAFSNLCKMCDLLDTRFTYQMLNRLNDKD